MVSSLRSLADGVDSLDQNGSVTLDDPPDPVEFARTVPDVLGKGNRPQPELGQTVVSLDVDVVGFDAVGHEYEQPVRTSAEKRRHRGPRDVRGRRATKVSVGPHLQIHLPRCSVDLPDRARLERRYEQFRQAAG